MIINPWWPADSYRSNESQYSAQDPPYYHRAVKAESEVKELQQRLIERTDQALHTARRDAETIRVLTQELEAIVNAKPSEWDDPSDFMGWAKSRARFTLKKVRGE